MTGINSTLDIARQALLANQYALSVTGQNIANAGNTNYSRQLVEFNSSGSVLLGGLVFGTGVDVSKIRSACDSTLVGLMSNQQSVLSAYDEKATNLNYIQDAFSLDTGNALDTLMSQFWNSWSELSNTPAGTAERSSVVENGKSVTTQLSTMDENLRQLSTTIDDKLKVAVDSINTITGQIDQTNKSIVAMEVQNSATANDLRDKRTALVNQLSGLLDISTYEQSDGSLLVTSGSGSSILVGSGGARDLSVSQGRIVWDSSGGPVDITDRISGGSIGGWLDVRDEVIPQYRSELDSLAKNLIWNVNYQHSQGVGLSYLSGTITGSYAADDSGLLSTLAFADKVDTSGEFKMWVENASTDPPTYAPVTVDLSAAAPVSSPTMAVSGTADSVGDTYTFKVTSSGADTTIGGSDDVTVNWTSSQGAGSFTVAAGDTTAVAQVDGMQIAFSGATGPFEGDTFVVTTDAQGVPSENVSSYTMQDFADAFNTAATAAGGGVTATVADGHIVFTADSGNYKFAFGDDGSTGNTESGLAAAFGVNTFFSGSGAENIGINQQVTEIGNIAAGKVDAATGENATGDNANALLLAECGDKSVEMPLWTYERGGDAVSTSVSTSTDAYYRSMVSALGVTSASVSQNKDTAETVMNQLQDRRDSISGVSIDEEMINLMKFQNAYSAASKLLSVSDDMLDKLLSIR